MNFPARNRFRFTVHYDGSAFHGWQVQPGHRTVQGDLEAALSRLADQPCSIIGSGRTDTGVHAVGQVACVDMPISWTAAALRKSMNAVLPSDVWIESTAKAAADFHPRYDARQRTYRYDVGLSPEAFSPFHRRWCWPVSDSVNRGRLDSAADIIVGLHSFQRFAKTGQPERGYRCDVADATWAEMDLGVRLMISADRYLHHMVRYLVGTMVDVARGRRPLEDMTRLLACDPDLVTSPPAPAAGLFLYRVEYPRRASKE